MAITPHDSLESYYVSDHDGWAFDIDEDGDLAKVEEAILAWQDWRDFLVKRAADSTSEPLF